MSIRRYSIINLAGSVIPTFVMLITVPLYLKALGDVRYGVLALVWLVLGYFSFLEMGLGKATANHIARLHDASDKERGTIFWTALIVNAAFGMIAALILWLIGSFLLTQVLKMPAAFRREALSALPWMIATLPLALVSSVLNGALEGRNRFLAVNSLQISSTVVFQVVPLVVAYVYSPSLSVVIPAAVLSRAFMNIPFLVACLIYVPLTIKLGVSREAVRSLLSYGGWVAVTGISTPILETLDRLLIGIVLGAQAVTHYTIPYQLVTKARIIPGSLVRALFPRFSAEDPLNADKLAQTSLVALLVVMTPAIVCGIFFLKPFMIIWIGHNLAAIASPIGEILLFGVWANSLAYIPYCLLQGKGRPDIVAKFHALEIGPFLLIIWAAMHFWGLYGAALAWTTRAVVDAALLLSFSGMSKGYMSVIGTPAIIVISAVVGTQYAAGAGWPWHVALALSFIIWIAIWLKKSGGNEMLAKIISIKKVTYLSDES